MSARRSEKSYALSTLQAGRGIAALLVLLFHATGLFASASYWNTIFLHSLFSFGHAGVEFFFALSGFIMVLVHQRDLGKPNALYAYARKRVTRIYPIYWIVTLVVATLYAITGNERLSLLGNSIILVGRDNTALLAVAWTLFHEILFYSVFAIMILNRRLGLIAFTAWFSICIWFLGKEVPHYAVAPLNVVFAFGMLAAVSYTRLARPLIVLWPAIGAFCALGVEEVYLGLLANDARSLLYGAVAAIGIAAAVAAETTGSISSPKWLITLGDSSYSLYLVHYPVLAIVGQIWLASPLRSLPSWMAFPALVFAAITAGFATHLLVEKRLMAILNQKSAEA